VDGRLRNIGVLGDFVRTAGPQICNGLQNADISLVHISPKEPANKQHSNTKPVLGPKLDSVRQFVDRHATRSTIIAPHLNNSAQTAIYPKKYGLIGHGIDIATMSEQQSESPDGAQSNSAVVSAYDEHLIPIWKSLDVPVKRASGVRSRTSRATSTSTSSRNLGDERRPLGNDAVVDAATEQLEEFVHGCSYVHPNEPVADLAERIADVTPGDLQKSFFCNSGTEAVEGPSNSRGSTPARRRSSPSRWAFTAALSVVWR